MRELIDKKATIKALMAEYKECSRDGEEMGGEAVLMAEGLDSAIDIVRRQPPVSAPAPEPLEFPTLLFSKRMAIAKAFDRWCEENNAARSPVNVVSFLHINQLIDVDAACKKIEKWEKEATQ